MPGLGGEVMQRAGATQVTMPASEIFTALQTGAIDAAEWVGPYNDVALGLHKAARYYYFPGFHEPGPAEQCVINKAAWDSLPGRSSGNRAHRLSGDKSRHSGGVQLG